MKVSTKGRYAIEAIVDLSIHSRQNLENLKNISDRLDISKNYLEQIFVSLKKNKIVDSVRGPKGGYKLARDAKHITAGDVIRAVEGSLTPVNCVKEEKCNHPCGSYETCVTRVLWENMMNTINKVTDEITINDLAEAYEKMVNDNYIEYYI